MATATRRNKIDKDVAPNISREMDKILKAWREKYPGVEEGSRRFDEKFRAYRSAHPEMAEYEDYDDEEEE